MPPQEDVELAQAATSIRGAFESGRLHVRPEDASLLAEIMGAPRGILGVVDTSNLSPEARSFARVVGLALRGLASLPAADVPAVPMAELQQDLFLFFAILFTALVGVGPNAIVNVDEIRERMMHRVMHDGPSLEREVNAAVAELEKFYAKHAKNLFGHAKALGGVKLVTGGQRAFGPSALTGVRIVGLYADTQLIPDPVYPYLSGEMHLNARHLQLARALFFILQLRPLVDARLAVPPVFVFPSFEMELEVADPVTMQGIGDLALRLISPTCREAFQSVDEIAAYARIHEDQFVRAVMGAGLFVPPGSAASERMSGDEAIKRYLAELEGVRDAKVLAQMRRLPAGALLLNGILERLAPQYHLYENATSLDAQPLLSQDVHWHYYELCAQATAQSLVSTKILSDEAFQTLRALQDESLGWLATIPIEGLVELNANQEHRFLRTELSQFTSQLVSAGPADLSDVVREVNHALADLVQRQQKALRDIEDKYTPRKWGVYAGGALTVVGAATALMLPSLAPTLGLTAPAIGAAAGMAGGAIGYGKEKAGEVVEKRRAAKTMLGMLATARPKLP